MMGWEVIKISKPILTRIKITKWSNININKKNEIYFYISLISKYFCFYIFLIKVKHRNK